MQPELMQLLPGYLQKDENHGTALIQISLQEQSSRFEIIRSRDYRIKLFAELRAALLPCKESDLASKLMHFKNSWFCRTCERSLY